MVEVSGLPRRGAVSVDDWLLTFRKIVVASCSRSHRRVAIQIMVCCRFVHRVVLRESTEENICV